MLNRFSFTIPWAMVVWFCACSGGISKEPSDTSSESPDSDTATDAEIVDSDDKDTDTDGDTATETESDTEGESDTGYDTDCALLDDFERCGDDQICFEETCVSFTETVVDENTTGIEHLGNLNVVSGRLFASHSHTEGMLFSQTKSQILELADGGLKGAPFAEIEGGYAALAGIVALGNPRVFFQYGSGSWSTGGDLFDALAQSEIDAASTFLDFDDMTYVHRCDDFACTEFTDNYEVLGVSEEDEKMVRRCSYAKTLMSRNWSCKGDISIPDSYSVRKLLALTSKAVTGEKYDLFAVSTKPVGYWDWTIALLKAEHNGSWTFVEQGDIAYHSDMGTPADIHGNSPNNLWLVGGLGFVAHWNGSELTEFRDLFPYDGSNNRYNFKDVFVTEDRIYFLGSRRDKSCLGNVCEAKLGSIIVAHNLGDDHTDPSTYKVHQLSGLYCQTDQGENDPDYKSCAAVAMADQANEIIFFDDEVYIVGQRWFVVGEGNVARATIWHASL